VSQENVELVRRLVDAAARRDMATMLSLYDPDVVLTNFANAPDSAPYIGHSGIRKWDEDVRDAIGDYRFVADEFIDVDENRVIVVGRICGQGRESGITVEIAVSGVLTLARARIVEVRAYETKSEALKAVGLEE
jgi:ketosteroid isomerase-like protein